MTGGAGFLGSHLCDRLRREGYDVVAVDNLASGDNDNVRHLADDPGFTLVRHDVTTPLRVPGPVHAVAHLAALPSPRDYLRRPLETVRVGSLGTLNALELAKDNGARFVLASTSEVYGDPAVHPQPETYWGNVNPVGPRAVYDEGKRFGEAAATAYREAAGLSVGIARIFNTYGPRLRAGDGRVVPTFVCQALAGVPLTVHGDGRQTRSLCYVDDLVDGLFRLMTSDRPGPVNLGNPQEMTVLDIARMVKELTGSSSPVTWGPLPSDDPTRRRPDIARARAELGWEPTVGIEEGLLRTIDWFAARRTALTAAATPS